MMIHLTREMNCEVVPGVDQYSPSYLSKDVKFRTYLVVNVIIVVLCGMSTVLSLISLLAEKAWISDELHRSIPIQGTSQFLIFL